MVSLPAAPTKECAWVVAAEVATVFAEVLGLERRGRGRTEAAGVVDDARLALAVRGHGEEGKELLGEEEVGEVVGLGVVSCHVKCQQPLEISNIPDFCFMVSSDVRGFGAIPSLVALSLSAMMPALLHRTSIPFENCDLTSSAAFRTELRSMRSQSTAVMDAFGNSSLSVFNAA